MNQEPTPKKSWWGSRAVNYFIGAIVVIFCSIVVQKCEHKPLYVDPFNEEWTNIKNSLNEISDTLLNGDQSKKRFCNCVLNKFESKYPSGENSIPNDSLNSLSFRYSEECSSSLKDLHYKTTSLMYRDAISNILSSEYTSFNKLDSTQKAIFANCMMRKIREKYPVEIVGSIKPKLLDTLYKTCEDSLKF